MYFLKEVGRVDEGSLLNCDCAMRAQLWWRATEHRTGSRRQTAPASWDLQS